MPSDDDLVPIPDLKAKLTFLMNDADAQKVGRHTGGEPSFAKALGVARSTAHGWLDPVGTRRSAIPSAVNRQIAGRFRFPSADWQPWLLYSATVFQVEYEKRARQLLDKPPAASVQAGGEADLATSSDALAWKAPATREIIARLLKVRALVDHHGETDGMMTLATDGVMFEALPQVPGNEMNESTALRCVRIQGQRPQSKDFDLASIEIPRPESWNEGVLPWPLTLDIYLGSGAHGLCVRAALIAFEMTGAACIDEYRDRTSCPGGMDVLKPNSGAMPKGFRLIPKGPTQSPRYELACGKAPIGGFTAHHIIRVYNAVVGDRVTVRLQIAIVDLADVIRGDDEQLG